MIYRSGNIGVKKAFKIGFEKYTVLLLLVLFISCQSDSNPEVKRTEAKQIVNNRHSGLLFKSLSADQTGIDFQNEVKETYARNIMQYDYIYNGGGVSVGDINNDGLPDVFFTGNDTPSKLYLNKGNLKFEDISAAIKQPSRWASGSNMVDVNNDGLLDIYVCISGPTDDVESLRNLLYINNGDLSFTESSKQYGLDIYSRAVQSVFFDYDKDGDLDCWISNHALSSDGLNLVEWYKDIMKDGPDKIRHMSNYLLRNDNGKFVDVSFDAGVFNIAFGLGTVAADINDDSNVDVYLSNDFFMPDQLYQNNGKGAFKDVIKNSIDHTSFFSMGADVADINNDNILDIATVDMTPSDHVRNKTLMSSMNTHKFKLLSEDLKFVKQFMFNSLQIGMGEGKFSEVSQLMGLSKTEWSWAVLLADFDNDGYKDYYVTNGFLRETKDNDYRRELQEYRDKTGVGMDEHIFKLLTDCKSIPINNNLFSNINGKQFVDKTSEWTDADASFSNGAAYADLDNDGDLDIVVNNIRSSAFVLENIISKNNWLRIELVNPENPAAVKHAKLELHYNNEIQRVDYFFERGYQSSVEPIAHFGLGDIDKVDQLVIKWLDGTKSVVRDIELNKKVVLDKSQLKKEAIPVVRNKTLFAELTDQIPNFNIKHNENYFDDFINEILLPHKYSDLGPTISVTDVNGDGYDDIFLGGSKNSPARIFKQVNQRFELLPNPDFDLDTSYEDLGSCFFDADGDGDQDLYIASGGGSDILDNPSLTQDRFYINNGKGLFMKQNLPQIISSTQEVVAFDYDNDKDLDLLVAARNRPGYYPLKSKSYLLENKKGKFVEKKIKGIEHLNGMITGISAVDIDKDGRKDIIAVGEWSSPIILKNVKDEFQLQSIQALNKYTGWWQSITAVDIDQDGDEDFVLGNLGENNKWNASFDKPLGVIASDFDQSGSHDIVLTKQYKGEEVPVRGKQCSTEQMPFIKSKFPSYHEFATSNVNDILGLEQIEKATKFEARTFKSIILKNNGGFKFEVMDLPIEAQWFPIKDVIADDFNKDGKIDLALGGNIANTEPETASYDAGKGLLLKGDGAFSFDSEYLLSKSGLMWDKDVRELKEITFGDRKGILVANNNDRLQLFYVK